VLREEFFGPVASVIVASGDDEAVALANDTPYGLSAYVFSGDAERARGIAARLRVGTVGVNCALVSDPALPFGGVRMSGIGRERGRAGVEEFLETKTIQVARP
jgi:succinate-semialdehyde dehydrogenase/glutarate-semialdehyde dehydrogenase